MTTSPVVSVTDEMIAELEAVAQSNDADCIEVHGISVGIVRAILAERAELKRDAERYRWLRDNWFQIYGESKGRDGIRISIGDIWNHAGVPGHVDAAIDAAMQS